jgi:iron-sulfur cluster repair protein YtfE (RIC family)
MLVHDHEVLTSQVEHVGALVSGVADRGFPAAAMREELVQQVEMLKVQLIEHFAFEEEAAFPYLIQAIPNDAERLRALARAHDRIARCLVEVAELVRLTTRETLLPQTGPIAAAFETFVNHYRRHLEEEADVLGSLEQKLSQEQQRELSHIANEFI